MRILVTDDLEQSGVDILRREGFEVDARTSVPPEELEKIISSFEALVVRSATQVTADVIAAASSMKVIGRAGTGVDNIDVGEATRRGILVMNTPGGNTISAAEHTVSMLLSLARNIPQAHMSLARGEWNRKKYIGTEVFEKTVGVVGLGKIGREVAFRCQGLGMKVVGYDPILANEVAQKLKIELVSLDELFRRSDFISLHTPLNNETRGLLNDDSLSRCKHGVRIINCARGGIIDEGALLRALQSGRVAGAALDVFETEPPKGSLLLVHEHVIATPHLGASTEEAQEKVAIQIAHQVADALRDRGFAGVVNSSALQLTMKQEVRPFVTLAEKMGSLVVQMTAGKVRRVQIGTWGDLVTSSIDLLRAGILKGILSRVLPDPVNYINAPFLAEEMGLAVVEQRESDGENFTNLLRVRYETDQEVKDVAGTVFGTSSIRLVKMDGFRFEVKPDGHLLIYNNVDKPGMLARVGGVLAKFNVNIAGVSLGRSGVGANALTVMNIDSDIPRAGMDELLKQEGVTGLRVIHLA